MFNDWEEKRIQKLKRCRHEREKIIMEQKVAVSNASKRQAKNTVPTSTSKLPQQKPTTKYYNLQKQLKISLQTNWLQSNFTKYWHCCFPLILGFSNYFYQRSSFRNPKLSNQGYFLTKVQFSKSKITEVCDYQK